MSTWRVADPSARLTDAADAQPPRETTPADAQDAVNFVVFEPEWLPADCRVVEVTRRPERPPGRPESVSAEELGQTPHSDGNPCSVRLVVAGDGRRFRLKQFLYDWAPPAASVAPLWRTPEPTPFDCGEAVGWLGTDYEGRRGGCVQRSRTQLEVSVLDGSFEDAELQRFLREVTPASPEEATRLAGVPFHRLAYWPRYGCRPPGVPHGLWDHGVARPYDDCVPVSPVGLPRSTPVQPLVPTDGRFQFDSAVAFPGAAAVECVYRRPENGSDHLWVVAVAPDSPLAPSVPPEPADQAAAVREAWELRGTTVHYAALTEHRGAWEAFWVEDGVHYAVWAGASQLLDGEGFRSVVAGLDAPDTRGE